PGARGRSAGGGRGNRIGRRPDPRSLPGRYAARRGAAPVQVSLAPDAAGLSMRHPEIGELTGPKASIRLDGFDRVEPDIVARAQGLSSATVHEAARKIGVVPSAIKPIHPAFRVCGPALTVHGPGGDNLWLHYAIYAAQPGDVIV